MGFGMGGGGRFGGRGGGPAKPKDAMKALRQSITWAKPLLPILLFGLACTLLGVYLGQQPPRVIQYTVDTVIGKGHYGLLPRTVAFLIGLYLTSQVIGSLSSYWMQVAGQRLLHTLRMTLYAQYQALSLSYFDNKRTGDLMSRVTGDVSQLESMIINTTNSLVRQLFGLLFALFYMLAFNWKLALLVLIPVPLLVLGMRFFMRRVRLVYRAIRDRMGDLSAKLQENLSGIRVIKAFNRERTEQQAIDGVSNTLMATTVKAARMTTIFYPTIGFIRSMGTVIVLGVGAHLISRGEFTVGKLMAFTMYVGNFYQPIDDFIRTFDSIQRSLASGERIFEVLDTLPEIRDPEQPVPLEDLRGEVELRDVRFRYATGDEVLRGVSIHAAPGQRVALVGHSGAGKSSFINLIPRFYDVTDGQVLVDGIDVRDVRQDDLRKRIALVLQETFLFNGTVRENLRFGREDATDEEIIAAAQAANAHGFIERLPEGYETQVGERGVKLSGGQKQRLSIARAVLADPRILILDEATSSVDSESEFLIHQALDRLMAGRTTFIIAHRLSTIRNADVILVLEGGRIVERGRHEALLVLDGRYAQMYHQQFWRQESDRKELELPSIQVTEAPGNGTMVDEGAQIPAGVPGSSREA